MSRRILIAEDSITRQKEMQQLLNDQGYEVLSVGSGDLAIEKVHEFSPHLVMLDVIMAGKNGYEVCGYIKNEPELNQIPVILTFSEDEPFDLSEARRVGATRCLPKTIDPENLIAILNFIWDGVTVTLIDPAYNLSENLTPLQSANPRPEDEMISEVEVEAVADDERGSPDDDDSPYMLEVKVRDTGEIKVSKNEPPPNGLQPQDDHIHAHPIEMTESEEEIHESTDDPLRIKESLFSTYCGDCGARVVIGDIFCVECGAALDEALIRTSTGTHCEQCGESIIEGDIFCLNCGAVQ